MPTEQSTDADLIDEAVLALAFLGICERDRSSGLARTWKSFDWAVIQRLYEKRIIHDPVGKAKSVYLKESASTAANSPCTFSLGVGKPRRLFPNGGHPNWRASGRPAVRIDTPSSISIPLRRTDLPARSDSSSRSL
jgi:hypothetical protein